MDFFKKILFSTYRSHICRANKPFIFGNSVFDSFQCDIMICWKEIVAVRSRVMELERQVNALKDLLSVRGIDLVDGWGFCQIISCSFSGKAKIKSLFHLDVQNTNEYYIKFWLALFFCAFYVLSWCGEGRGQETLDKKSGESSPVWDGESTLWTPSHLLFLSLHWEDPFRV